jgi:hypothetical protein
MKIGPVGPSCFMQKDRHDKYNSRISQIAKAPKNQSSGTVPQEQGSV